MESNTLNKFITRCDYFINRYNGFNDKKLIEHIFECTQEKRCGKAELMIELNEWKKLKTALIQCYSDRSDIGCLV